MNRSIHRSVRGLLRYMKSCRLTAFLLIACGSVVSQAASADTLTQSVTLVPGWNAIHLNVDPFDRDPANVFQGCRNVQSVWHQTRRTTEMDFSDNVEDQVRREEWVGWFGGAGIESELSNLFAIYGNRSFLVKMSGNQPCVLEIVGAPLLPRIRWAPNDFTLTGLPADPANPPTFYQYFLPSAAHSLQPVYELTPAGDWVPIASPAAQTIQRGRAYWFYTAGASTYESPFEVELSSGTALDFQRGETRLEFGLKNRTDRRIDVSVSPIPGESQLQPVPMLYEHLVLSPFRQFVWDQFVRTIRVPLDPERLDQTFPIGLARRYLAGDQVASLIEVVGGGVRHVLAVRASAAREEPAQGVEGGGATQSSRFAGLWVGTVSVDKVAALHKPTVDMRFDLGLRGVRFEGPAIGDANPPEEIEVLVRPGDEGWKIAPPDTTYTTRAEWTGSVFDDSAWKDQKVTALFPGENERPATILTDPNNGANLPAYDPTTQKVFYFRKTFMINSEQVSAYETLIVDLLRDDGAVVYLNGEPVIRSNMPDAADFNAEVSPDTPAARVATGAEEFFYHEIRLPGGEVGPSDFPAATIASRPVLVEGENVIAVEIHQHDRELEAPSGSETEPVKTASSFDFRVLMHVDRFGRASLLKEVIQMSREETTVPDPDFPGFARVDTPSRAVLVTDDEKIGQFAGVALRDGESVGRRISTAAYDFDPGDNANKVMTMSGNFLPGSGGTVTANLVVPSDLPTNPFRHRKHPHHDNRRNGVDIGPDDPEAPRSTAEVYAVKREMSFTFGNVDPDGARLGDGSPDPARPTPENQSMTTQGLYKETISGLHRLPIKVEGTFRLQRVAFTEELNQ